MPADLDDLLTSQSFFQDPYPVYHHLRTEAPVYWSEALGGWVLTRYDDVAAVLHSPASFLNSGRVTYLLQQLPPEARRQVEALERHYQLGVAHTDPPDHTRLRTLLAKAFTPRMVEAQRPKIVAVVNELLDAAAPKGRMDVIADLAYPLPATIIAGMIGAPAAHREQFRRWAIDINALQAQRTQVEMRDYILTLAAERRRRPQDDIISALVVAQYEGKMLSEAEIVSTCVTLFVAGHETTTNLIGNGTLALLRNPEQLQRLQDEPSLIPTAVEEFLRYDPPVQRGWRIAAAEVQMGAHRIQKGDLVLPMIGAANRDPARFPDPDRLDIARQNNRHLGFGYGIHFCLGAPLARIEAPIAIEALVRRFPSLRLATDSVEWTHDIALRGLRSLPVAL